MGFKIKKNTLRPGVAIYKSNLRTAGELAVARGLEVIRSSVVPLTPVVTGRLKNSLSGRTSVQSILIKGKGLGFFKEVQNAVMAGGVITKSTSISRTLSFETNDSVYNISNKDSKVVGTIGTNVPYAKYVEFGTSKQKAQYFFTNGFTLARDNVRRTIINTLKHANSN